MDQLNHYRDTIEPLLSDLVRLIERSSDTNPQLRNRIVFDWGSDNYLTDVTQ